jgi:hypothetical protein
VLAAHPVKERFDAFWIVRGRVAHWGPLPGASELAERTAAVANRAVRRGAPTVPTEEIDEVRIVAAWVAENEPPSLRLDPRPTQTALLRFAERATAVRAAA